MGMNKKVVVGMVVLVVLECLFVPTIPHVTYIGDGWRNESGWTFIGALSSSTEINPILLIAEIGLTIGLGCLLAWVTRDQRNVSE